MGRELRQVPMGWEHPKHERWNGSLGIHEWRLSPLFDTAYPEALDEWIKDYNLWIEGLHPQNGSYQYYWDWAGDPPHSENYRPEWTADQLKNMGYCVYENVSEGTPVSPIFKTKKEVQAWLIEHGHSEEAAAQFSEQEWAPSMTMIIEKSPKKVTIIEGIG